MGTITDILTGVQDHTEYGAAVAGVAEEDDLAAAARRPHELAHRKRAAVGERDWSRGAPLHRAPHCLLQRHAVSVMGRSGELESHGITVRAHHNSS